MRDSVPSGPVALDTAARADRAAPDAVLPPRSSAGRALADWPRQCLAGEGLESQLAYWRAALADLPPVLALPVDRARAPVQSLRGARLTTAIPAELSARLKALGQARGATLFMTLLAAFQVLLARHGAGPDIPVGTLVANPTRSAAQGLVERSVNILVLRGRLGPDLPFTVLLARTRETVLAAFDRQDLPFETLVEALNPPRSLSHGPLVQTMLVLQDIDSLDPMLPGAIATPLPGASPIAKFDLTMSVSESADGLTCQWEYAADLFMHATIERLAGRLLRLLEALVENPERPVADHDILLPAERRQLKIWNDTQTDLGPPALLDELVAASAKAAPERIALRAGEDRLTCRELLQVADILARRLGELGAGPDRIVAVCLERGMAMPVALLSILRSGAAYLPLDPELPPDRLAFMLKDADPVAVLTSHALRARLPSEAPTFDADQWFADARRAPALEPRRAGDRSVDDLAYVIYTSGSTGQPKGVMIPHRGIVNRMRWMQAAYRLGAEDRVLQKTPYAFDVSVWEFFWPMMTGATLVMAPPGAHRDPNQLAGIAERAGITTMHFVPSMLEAFLPCANPVRCRSLRRVFVSGEALTPELRDRFLDAGLSAELHNLYGPTEASVDVTAWPCGPGERGRGSPIGRPIANVRIHVLDAQARETGIGIPGEICIGGVALARGYLNRAQLTAERFILDPFSDEPGARLYRTGDRGRVRADGAIEYLGRADFQIKLRGHRIELGEIESVLRQHPGVRDAAAVLKGATAREQRIVAFVTSAAGGIDVDTLMRQARATLPAYMVPASFTVLKAFPLTPNGKLDRQALPEPTLSASGHGTPPQGETETLLAGLWSAVLGQPIADRTADFFAQGGHSLLATRLAARIRTAFAVEVPLKVMFDHPTLAEQGRWLAAQHRGDTLSPLRPQAPDTPPVLSFAQQRLWLLDALGAGGAYNVPCAVQLTGDLHVAALIAALTEVVRRHAVLRTTLTERDGRLGALLRSAAAVDLPISDLRRLPAAQCAAALARLAREESARPFDLAHDLLLRARLVRLADARGPSRLAEQVLLVTMHHIASDGWSVAVLVRELAALYGAFARSEPSPLPPLPIQYSDFAAWQRARLAGGLAEARLDWWKTRLAGAPALMDLPTDRPRPAAQSFRGGTLRWRIDGRLVRQLYALGAGAGATPFMTLLAAFLVLLARHCRQDDLVVAAPSAGRQWLELEPLIGYFVDNLPLRADLSGNPTFLQLLEQVRGTVQEALAHQELPFDRLVEALSPQHTANINPLMQVAFALQNIPLDDPDFAGLKARPLDLDLPGVRAELELHLWERPGLEPDGALIGECCYSTDLFDAATVARMLERLQVLLAGIAAHPEARVGDLPLLSAGERRQVLEGWNATATDFPQVPCIQALFEDWAARTPDAPALLWEDEDGGERILAYGALNARANRLAHHMIGLGVGPEAVVGLCLEPSVERLVGLLGVLKAGAAYLPLDSAYPPERLRFMLEDARPALILTHAPTRDLVEGLGVRGLCLDGDWPRSAAAPQDDPPRRVGPDSLAYVVYTSGSTGMPKGVQVEHRGLCNVAQAAVRMFDLHPADRLLQLAPFGFDVASYEIWVAFAAGAALCLASRDRTAPGEPLLGLLARRRISLLALTPPTLGALPTAPLPALRVLILGGESCAPDLVAVWRRGRQVFNAYGPTEATIWSTATPCADPHEPTVIGRPIANTSAYVLDDRGQLAPIGVAGELYVGGAGVARGYLNRSELTAERFVPNPFGAGRLYRTGDGTRWLTDGRLEFLGRIDRQIKIRGFRMEPVEIETALCADPRVTAAAVVAREDRHGDPRLVAYVVPCPADAGAVGQDHWRALRAHLRTRLPEHMVPAAIVGLAALPLTPNGKLDTAALPPPDLTGGAGAASRSPPRDDTERAVARVWQEILGLDALGIDDDFLDLGGHSLLATRIVARLREALGIGLPLSALFQARTIARLAALIGAARDARDPPQAPDPTPREEIAL
jgi:amino acid adenylation domain-containing protein